MFVPSPKDEGKTTISDNNDSTREFDYNATPLLISAIQKENIEYIQKLVENGSNLNVCDKNNITPLMAALSLKNCIDIVDYLLKKGADINFKVDYSPLTYAIKLNKETSIIEKLIDNGAEIYSCSKNGSTILHAAAANNNKETIQYLIKKGLYVNCLNLMNETPLHVAVKHGNYNTEVALVENGASINAQDIFGNTPLHIAFRNNDIASISFLIRNCKACITMHNKRYENIVSFLFAINDFIMDLFSKEQMRYFLTKYYLAASLLIRLDEHIFDRLVEAGIIHEDIRTIKGIELAEYRNLYGNKILWRSQCKHKDFPLPCDFLFGRGISQFVIAAHKGWDIYSDDLENHLNYFDTSTEKGNTVLHAVVKNGDYNLAKKLIESKRFDLGAKNSALFTPLLTAYYYGRGEIVELLMKNNSPKPDMELVEWIRAHTDEKRHNQTRIYDIFQEHYVKGVPVDKIKFPVGIANIRVVYPDRDPIDLGFNPNRISSIGARRQYNYV